MADLFPPTPPPSATIYHFHRPSPSPSPEAGSSLPPQHDLSGFIPPDSNSISSSSKGAHRKNRTTHSNASTGVSSKGKSLPPQPSNPSACTRPSASAGTGLQTQDRIIKTHKIDPLTAGIIDALPTSHPARLALRANGIPIADGMRFLALYCRLSNWVDIGMPTSLRGFLVSLTPLVRLPSVSLMT
jgi:hypothetical protein